MGDWNQPEDEWYSDVSWVTARVSGFSKTLNLLIISLNASTGVAEQLGLFILAAPSLVSFSDSDFHKVAIWRGVAVLFEMQA